MLHSHLLTLAHHHPLTIAQFMSEALGHPVHGYYRKQDPFGTRGDFITAPEISQVFGELVGIWCAYQWQQQGSPRDVHLAELGPGRGTLMKDLLRATKHVPGFHESIRVHLVETSPVLQQKQREMLAGVAVEWHNDIYSLPGGPLLLVANEFFDALPIHQYIRTKQGWVERLVRWHEEAWQFVMARGLSPLSPFLMKHYPQAAEYALIEICPAAQTIMQALAERLLAGIVIDYGYTEPPFRSTLQALKDHTPCSVLEHVGDADITAHVDFTALANNTTGHQTAISSQRDFLLSMGIEARAAQLKKNATPAQVALLDSAIERLISVEEMGMLFKVLTISSRHTPSS